MIKGYEDLVVKGSRYNSIHINLSKDVKDNFLRTCFLVYDENTAKENESEIKKIDEIEELIKRGKVVECFIQQVDDKKIHQSPYAFIVFGFIEKITFDMIREKYSTFFNNNDDLIDFSNELEVEEKKKELNDKCKQEILDLLINNNDNQSIENDNKCIVILNKFGNEIILSKLHSDLYAYICGNCNFKTINWTDEYNDSIFDISNEIRIIKLNDYKQKFTNINRIHFLQAIKIKSDDRKILQSVKNINDKRICFCEINLDFNKIADKEINTSIDNINNDTPYNAINRNLNLYLVNGTNFGIFDCCFEVYDDFKDTFDTYKYFLNVFGSDIINMFKESLTLKDIKIQTLGNTYYLELTDNIDDEHIKKIMNNSIKSSDNDTLYFNSNYIIWNNPNLSEDGYLYPFAGPDTLYSTELNMYKESEIVENKYNLFLLNLIKKSILLRINDKLLDAIYQYNNYKVRVPGSVLLDAYSDNLNVMMFNNKNNYLNLLFPNLMEKLDVDMGIDKLNNDYNKYTEAINKVIDVSSKIEDNKLADMLNTIQIASIVLTIFGWLLVIFQSTSRGINLYIIFVIIFSILSIVFAILVKKLISKK